MVQDWRAWQGYQFGPWAEERSQFLRPKDDIVGTMKICIHPPNLCYVGNPKMNVLVITVHEYCFWIIFAMV